MTDNNDVGRPAGREVISDAAAKTLASVWIDTNPEWPTNLLHTTGEITDETVSRLTRDAHLHASCDPDGQSPTAAQLAALAGYVTRHGPRGPVDGWQQIPSASPDIYDHPFGGPARKARTMRSPTEDLVAVVGGGDRDKGAAALGLLVSDFYQAVLARPNLRPLFDGSYSRTDWTDPANLPRLEAKFGEMVTAGLSGLDAYQGTPILTLLRRAHAHLPITENVWSETIEVFLRVLADPKWGLTDAPDLHDEIVRRVAGFHDAVVTAG